MTGFGRGECKTDTTQCIVEIKTVNHRYSDYTIKMSRDLMCLEDKIRAVLQESICRGKTDVYITFSDMSESNKKIVVDEKVVSAYFEAIDASSSNLNYHFKPDASLLFKIPDAFVQFKEELDQDFIWKHLSEALNNALINLTAMREIEGSKLKLELETILSKVESLFENVKERSPMVPVEYKEKLSLRLSELIEKGMVDEQRIAAEVAMFADKCSIDEEIARLDSHIKQFYDALNSDGSIGRRLDFIVQEMNREVNTIGSKANDIIITNNVIALKSEIEKLREQLQNLE